MRLLNNRASSELNWGASLSLLWPVMGLLLLGSLTIVSASMPISEKLFQAPFHYAIRQVWLVAAAVVMSFFLYQWPMERWRRLAKPLFWLTLMGLLLVLMPGVGKTVNGATRWIDLKIVTIQVSELMKLAYILFLSEYLSRHHVRLGHDNQVLVLPGLVTGATIFLLLCEPDFGSSVVITLLALLLLFLSGLPWRYFLGLILSAGLGLLLLALSAPYRLARMTTFWDPWQNPFDSGYQLTQALIAFGRAQWLGLGLGGSIQKLFYLPEAHTDFVLAILVEEQGLIGGIFIMLMYVWIFFRGQQIAYHAMCRKAYFESLVAHGVSAWLTGQALINMGVNMGLLPTKGLTLPFISYGLNSLWMSMIGIVLLLRIEKEQSASTPYYPALKA